MDNEEERPKAVRTPELECSIYLGLQRSILLRRPDGSITNMYLGMRDLEVVSINILCNEKTTGHMT
jgi:hypothetical protein